MFVAVIEAIVVLLLYHAVASPAIEEVASISAHG
jgi:hypothetical protein